MTYVTQNETRTGWQRPPEAMDGAFLEFAQPAQIELLRREPAYQHGRRSKTLAKYRDLRVVLACGPDYRTHHSRPRPRACA